MLDLTFPNYLHIFREHAVPPLEDTLQPHLKQYDLFSPGLNEWPALLRRCDAKDPSYKE